MALTNAKRSSTSLAVSASMIMGIPVGLGDWQEITAAITILKINTRDSIID